MVVGRHSRRYYSTKEVEEATGVPRHTIDYYYREGHLKGVLSQPEEDQSGRRRGKGKRFTEEHLKIIRSAVQLIRTGVSTAEAFDRVYSQSIDDVSTLSPRVTAAYRLPNKRFKELKDELIKDPLVQAIGRTFGASIVALVSSDLPLGENFLEGMKNYHRVLDQIPDIDAPSSLDLSILQPVPPVNWNYTPKPDTTVVRILISCRGPSVVDTTINLIRAKNFPSLGDIDQIRIERVQVPGRWHIVLTIEVHKLEALMPVTNHLEDDGDVRWYAYMVMSPAGFWSPTCQGLEVTKSANLDRTEMNAVIFVALSSTDERAKKEFDARLTQIKETEESGAHPYSGLQWEELHGLTKTYQYALRFHASNQLLLSTLVHDMLRDTVNVDRSHTIVLHPTKESREIVSEDGSGIFAYCLIRGQEAEGKPLKLFREVSEELTESKERLNKTAENWVLGSLAFSLDYDMLVAVQDVDAVLSLAKCPGVKNLDTFFIEKGDDIVVRSMR